MNMAAWEGMGMDHRMTIAEMADDYFHKKMRRDMLAATNVFGRDYEQWRLLEIAFQEADAAAIQALARLEAAKLTDAPAP